ncbi:Mab-21 domain containing protein, partial [Asbolus verrucosus]
MAEDRRRYNYLERVLAEINDHFISLPKEDVKKNNEILKSVLDNLIRKMKEKDPLFKAMYKRVFYGGSYYDGLRVGKPEEFDLDLLLSLPTFAKPVLTTGDIPGFVHLHLEEYDAWMKQPEAMPAYRTFSDLFDRERFLDTEKVLAWMEGIVQKSLNEFPAKGSKTIFENKHGTFEVIFQKGGPALTLKITGPDFKMDVDLVTCFVFHADKWPTNGFRPNPVESKPDFFIVPKKPKVSGNESIPRYWRLSFQEQERKLMEGKRTLKPTVKLLKKLRDSLDHKCIASYYIKTVLLHIIEKKDDEFWQNSLSYVFMTVLKEYREDYIEKRNIPYYWNESNNLIGGVNQVLLENMNNRLKNVIKRIELNSIRDPYAITSFIHINSKFICLDTDDVKRNNKILQSVLNTIINKMKEKDPLFKALFTRVFYGGSYYDGLRVGNPEEFDLDLLLSLPTFAEPTLTTSNIPGFVHLQLKKFDAWMKQPEAMPAYRTFSNLFDDQRYLDTQKVLAWMEGIVQKSLNDFPTSGSKKMLTNENGRFEVIVQKGGPALTLKISGPSGLKMDVDLVTCFVFHADKWPTNGFKKNPVRSKPDFFIVPKKPKASGNEPIPRYWRLSFQEQERVLIDGKRTLKPTIKLLK